MTAENSYYKTQAQYINYLCALKDLTIKQLCNELNLNYKSLVCNYKKVHIGVRKLIKIIKYLDGDMNIVLDLPTERELRQGVNKNK